MAKGFAFASKPPAEASAYFRQKGDRPAFRWTEVWGEEHAHAFTVAKAVQADVLKAIRDLNAGGLTCVLVEQNVAVSLKLASKAYVLENGRITLSGTGEALLADDRVRQAYLGM